MNHHEKRDDAPQPATSLSVNPNTTENTPSHCHQCWKFDTCLQAQHMTADTEPVPGFVETNKFVDYFCTDCLPEDARDESLYPMDYEEVDSPCHCSVCGIPLIHSLTSEGARYVRELLSTDEGCCRELWPVVWSEYIPPEPYFDSFDVCEAHYLYALLHDDSETITRLYKMGFKPGLSLIKYDRPEKALTENGQAIYYRLLSIRSRR